MKTLPILLVGGAAAIVAHSNAIASENQGLYVGIGVGQTQLIDYELYQNDEWQSLIDGMRSTSGSSAVTSSSIGDPEDKNSETSISFFGGLRFSQWLGVEGGIAYHGIANSEMSASTSYTTGAGDFSESLTAEAETLTYSGKGSLNIYWEMHPGIELYGKLGAHYWVREYKEDVVYSLSAPDPANSITSVATRDFDDSTISPYVGIGFQWEIASDAAVRIGAEYYSVESDKRTDWDMTSASIEFIYRFGVEEPGIFHRESKGASKEGTTACNEKYRDLFSHCD